MIKRQLIFYITILFLINIFLGRCAKEAMPTGGPRDTIPPQVKRYYPKPFATNFKGKKIIFKFNEYIELKQIDKNFFSSPPFAKTPKFKLVGKKLIVKFRDTLRDSVTYTLEFGNAIVDYTEGNPLENFKFVFSTYDKIDTLQIAGKVIDAYTLEPQEGIYVMLYRIKNPQIVHQQPPVYVTVTDKEGKFRLFGLKEGHYRLFALKDLNFDFKYNGIENYIGFSGTLISPKAKVIIHYDSLKAGTIIHDAKTGKIIDTLKKDTVIVRKEIKYYPENLLVRMFKDQNRPQGILDVVRRYPYLVIVKFNYPLFKNFYQLWSENYSSDKFFVAYIPKTDSLKIWLTDPKLAAQDSLSFFIKFYTRTKSGLQLTQDTIRIGKPIFQTAPLKLYITTNKILSTDSLNILSSTLIRTYNKTNFLLYNIIDTNANRTFLPNPKCLRSDKDKIDIIFTNSIDSIAFIYLNDLQIIKYNLNSEKTHLSLTIPPKYQNLDTIDFYIAYWKTRFNSTPQIFYCHKKLTLIRQTITKIQWDQWNHIRIEFLKPLNNLKIKEISSKPQKIKTGLNSVDLYFANPDSTIKIKLEAIDFENLGIKPIVFTKTLNLTYKWQQNKIEKVARPTRGNILVKFQKPVYAINSIDVINVGKKKMAITNYKLNNDTLKIFIENKDLKRTKFLKFAISYKDLKWRTPVNLTDTITVEYGTNQLAVKTYYVTKQPFNLKLDKTTRQTFVITSDFKQGHKYRLVILPNAFTDIENRIIDTIISFDFNILSKQNTAKLKFTIVNKPKDYNGWIIIQLRDKDNKIIREKVIKNSDIVIFDNLPEDNFFVYIILDKNKDGSWDTGNYNLQIEPEQVYNLPKQIKTKLNWEIEEQIDFSKLDTFLNN